MKFIFSIIIVGIVIVFFVHLKRKQDEIEANFQKRFAGKKIQFMDKHALYVAKESDGYSHFRGQGYLVLTEDELYFERQLVKKTIKIPTGSIIKVAKTKRLAGQGPGTMLKVVFKTFYHSPSLDRRGVIHEFILQPNCTKCNNEDCRMNLPP